MIAMGINLRNQDQTGRRQFHTETGTDMASEMIAKTYRGTLAKIGAIDMKLVPVKPVQLQAIE